MMKCNVLRKNLLTNEIDYGDVDSEFESENLKGNIITDFPWIELSENSLDYSNHLFVTNKQKKLQELDACYASTEVWTFTIKSNVQNSLLIKDANWFGSMLPAVNGQIKLYDAANNIKQFPITFEQALKLNNLIKIVKSFEIKTIYLMLKNSIIECNNNEELQSIDVKHTLLFAVDKTIILEDTI